MFKTIGRGVSTPRRGVLILRTWTTISTPGSNKKQQFVLKFSGYAQTAGFTSNRESLVVLRLVIFNTSKIAVDDLSR